MHDLIAAVSALLREVADEIVLPRFRSLADHEVNEKTPGDLVTVADREAELMIGQRLSELRPGAPVVGEEACADDPSLLDAVNADVAWVVDPIDGTGNFVAGSDDFAMMIALLHCGETVASWIWQPIAQRMYVAERGGGATCNGTRLHCSNDVASEAPLHGALHTWYMPEDLVQPLIDRAASLGTMRDGRKCSGVEYPLLAECANDFVVFWRTLPWDHAPGTLLVTEAGGVARFANGVAYRAGDATSGLIVSRNEVVAATASQLFDIG